MDRIKNNKFMQNLKTQAEANPVVTIAVTAALLTAAAKLMDANTQRSYAKTHAIEVARRVALKS